VKTPQKYRGKEGGKERENAERGRGERERERKRERERERERDPKIHLCSLLNEKFCSLRKNKRRR